VIFVDTGAFVARYLARDEHHQRAVASWKRLARNRTPCATSNHVLDETFTLLGRWASYSFAAERARLLLSSRVLEILRPAAEEELAAVELFEKYADQEVSFTDALSFALMRRRRIDRAFTFDRHFRFAGFTMVP
jgi:predicted nucleic acid-binding protein